MKKKLLSALLALTMLLSMLPVNVYAEGEATQTDNVVSLSVKVTENSKKVEETTETYTPASPVTYYTASGDPVSVYASGVYYVADADNEGAYKIADLTAVTDTLYTTDDPDTREEAAGTYVTASDTLYTKSEVTEEVTKYTYAGTLYKDGTAVTEGVMLDGIPTEAVAVQQTSLDVTVTYDGITFATVAVTPGSDEESAVAVTVPCSIALTASGTELDINDKNSGITLTASGVTGGTITYSVTNADNTDSTEYVELKNDTLCPKTLTDANGAAIKCTAKLYGTNLYGTNSGTCYATASLDTTIKVVEKVAPAVTAKITSDKKSFGKRTINFTVEASDDHLKTAYYLLTTSSTFPAVSEMTEITSQLTSGSYSSSISIPRSDNNYSSDYYLYVYAVDTYGNLNSAKDDTTKNDKTEPDYTITIGTANADKTVDKTYYYKAAQTITVKVTDDNLDTKQSKVTYTSTVLENGEEKATSKTVRFNDKSAEISISAGEKVSGISVYTVDTSGNEGGKSAAGSNVDTGYTYAVSAAPDYTITIGSEAYQTVDNVSYYGKAQGDTQTITVKVTDKTFLDTFDTSKSSVKYSVYSVNGTEQKTAEFKDNTAEITIENGQKVSGIDVTAVDMCGQSGSKVEAEGEGVYNVVTACAYVVDTDEPDYTFTIVNKNGSTDEGKVGTYYTTARSITISVADEENLNTDESKSYVTYVLSAYDHAAHKWVDESAATATFTDAVVAIDIGNGQRIKVTGIKTIDLAGNEGEIKKADGADNGEIGTIYVIDSNSPEIELTVDNKTVSGTGYYTSRETIAVSVSDATLDSVSCKVNGKKLALTYDETTASFEINTEDYLTEGTDGTLKIVVEANDKAKNPTSETEYTYVYDSNSPEIELTVDNKTVSGTEYYNKLKTVKLDVTDYTLDSVSYTVSVDGAEKETVNVKTSELPVSINLAEKTYLEEVTDATVVIKVNANDKAENPSETEYTYVYDTTPPDYTITIGDQEYQNINGVYYYGIAEGAQTITIQVTDKELNLDTNNSKVTYTVNGVTKTAAFNKGKTTIAVKNGQRVVITKVNIVDLAGNKGTQQEAGGKANNVAIGNTYVVDTVRPKVTVSSSGINTIYGSDGTIYMNPANSKTVTITVTIDDVNYSGKKTTTITLPCSDQNTVYKILNKTVVDLAGNKLTKSGFSIAEDDALTGYAKQFSVASDGTLGTVFVVDRNVPQDGTDTSKPEISLTRTAAEYSAADGTDLYDAPVTYTVKVDDPVVNKYASGLKSVDYTVYNGETVILSGTETTGSFTFTADASSGECNNVRVVVVAADNVGNVNTRTDTIAIDKQAPRVTEAYDSTNASTYYNAPRTVTLSAEDLNWSGATMRVNGQNTALTWAANGITHSASYTFATDGVYTMGVNSYTDYAGHTTNGTLNDTFTIDMTAPEIDVTYNGSEDPDSYYNADFKATITITEVNFSRENVTVTDNGTPVTVEWNPNGDANTADVNFSAEGSHKIEVTCTDLAGNAAAPYSGKSFILDKTAPVVEITGVEDAHAYKAGDTVNPVITFTDDNFNTEGVTINWTYSTNAESNQQTAAEFKKNDNGTVRTADSVAEKPENDGIYVLTVTATDLAGNTSAPVTVTYSLNRFGSNFTVNTDTQSVIDNEYTDHAQDIVIIETNADEVVTHDVTLNGRSLTEGTDYTVSAASHTAGGWYQYTYTVNASVFGGDSPVDGTYEIIVYSEDAAGNKSTNKTETEANQKTVSFTIDTLAPSGYVTVDGLKDGASDIREAQTNVYVYFDTSDVSGVSAVTLYVKTGNDLYRKYVLDPVNSVIAIYDGDDQLIDEQDMTAEEIANFEQGYYVITLEQNNKEYTVYAEIQDAAGNSAPTAESVFFLNTSALRQFVHNTPVFVGSIVGLAAVIALIIFLIARKKRSK